MTKTEISNWDFLPIYSRNRWMQLWIKIQNTANLIRHLTNSSLLVIGCVSSKVMHYVVWDTAWKHTSVGLPIYIPDDE